MNQSAQSASSARTPRPSNYRMGSTATKFSVATTRSWKDDSGEWKNKSQWHDVIALGQSFAEMAPRLLKGSLVFVQGQLTTREDDGTIQVPIGKKTVDHVIQQLTLELKAEMIRPLDRSAVNTTELAQPAN